MVGFGSCQASSKLQWSCQLASNVEDPTHELKSRCCLSVDSLTLLGVGQQCLLAGQGPERARQHSPRQVDRCSQLRLTEQAHRNQLKIKANDRATVKMSMAETETHHTADSADLTLTDRSLAKNTVAFAHRDCQLRAADFQAATKSRSEEQKALAEARSAISEKTGCSKSFGCCTYQCLCIRFLSRHALRIQTLRKKASASSSRRTYFDKELAERNAEGVVVLRINVTRAACRSSSTNPTS